MKHCDSAAAGEDAAGMISDDFEGCSAKQRYFFSELNEHVQWHGNFVPNFEFICSQNEYQAPVFKDSRHNEKFCGGFRWRMENFSKSQPDMF